MTYTMSEAQRTAFLETVKEGVRESCDEEVSGEDKVESFTEITFNDDLSAFSISVERDAFSAFDSLRAIGYYYQGMYYQYLAGVEPDDIDVAVEFVDEDTGEVLQSGTLKRMLANAESSAEGATGDASEETE